MWEAEHPGRSRPSVLSRLYGYGLFPDKRPQIEALTGFLHKTFASMMVEVVQKLDAPTIEGTFLGNEEKVKDLWKLVRHEDWSESAPSRAVRVVCGAEVLKALFENGLPKACWAGLCPSGNINLLQLIIKHICSRIGSEIMAESHAPGQLCILLASNLSLGELCREDKQGMNVLGHVEIARSTEIFLHEEWFQELHRVMAENMKPCVEEFEGSKSDLMDLAQSVGYGLQGNLSAIPTLFLSSKSPSQITLKYTNRF